MIPDNLDLQAVSGVDEGGGSHSSRASSFSTFYLIYHKFPHEIEII